MDGLSGLFVSKMQKAAVGKVGEKVLSDSALEHVSGEILGSIRNLKGDGERVLLVVDQLDLLLAAGGEQIGAVDLGDMLMGLREVRLKCSRWWKTFTEIGNRRFILLLLRCLRIFLW